MTFRLGQKNGRTLKCLCGHSAFEHCFREFEETMCIGFKPNVLNHCFCRSFRPQKYLIVDGRTNHIDDGKQVPQAEG